MAAIKEPANNQPYESVFCAVRGVAFLRIVGSKPTATALKLLGVLRCPLAFGAPWRRDPVAPPCLWPNSPQISCVSVCGVCLCVGKPLLARGCLHAVQGWESCHPLSSGSEEQLHPFPPPSVLVGSRGIYTRRLQTAPGPTQPLGGGIKCEEGAACSPTCASNLASCLDGNHLSPEPSR